MIARRHKRKGHTCRAFHLEQRCGTQRVKKDLSVIFTCMAAPMHGEVGTVLEHFATVFACIIASIAFNQTWRVRTRYVCCMCRLGLMRVIAGSIGR